MLFTVKQVIEQLSNMKKARCKKMNQEELKNQFLRYAEYNLNDDTIIKAIIDLLDPLCNSFYENGHTKESNTLNMIIMQLRELLENN